MREYNEGMRNAVQLWESPSAGGTGGLRQPPSNVHRVVGGDRPVTGSEARTLIAQYATFSSPCTTMLRIAMYRRLIEGGLASAVSGITFKFKPPL